MEINGLNHLKFVVRRAYSVRVSNFDHYPEIGAGELSFSGCDPAGSRNAGFAL